jgi:hypothetical protein
MQKNSQALSITADPLVGRAVAAIVPNSDKQFDNVLLEKTFVDIGVLAQVQGNNSQVVFGRRGTGKSHLLRILASRSSQGAATTATYVDVRNLGSAQVMADPMKSLTTRAVTIYRDLLGEVQSRLIDLATDPQQPSRIDALESVSELADTIATISINVASRDISAGAESSARRSAMLTGQISHLPSIAGQLSSDRSSTSKYEEHYKEELVESVNFVAISVALSRVMANLHIDKLLLIIDEWSSIPEDIQPYIADFLRRTIVYTPQFIVKFGAVPYRSNFSTTTERAGRIGLEFGGEITRNIDLDENYVFERDPDVASAIFGQLLWVHLAGNLEQPDHLSRTYGVSTDQELVDEMFADSSAYKELLMAAGGVPRDFLTIFSSAYFRSAVARAPAVDVAAVRKAAQASYQIEKLMNLDDQQREMLARITGGLRGAGSANFFLIRSSSLTNRLIESLLDMRVMHLIVPNYFDARSPSGRHAMLMLDYGASLATGLAGVAALQAEGLTRGAAEESLLNVPDLSSLVPEGDDL